MKVLIAGGSGFLGSSLAAVLKAARHETWILTRRSTLHDNELHWDGVTTDGWGSQIDQFDALVNLTGFGLEHWPWTAAQKRKFYNSRIPPGQAMLSAVRAAKKRPRVFLQISGVNYYGLRGAPADESTPAAGDYLAQLAFQWEAATQPVEELGVRHVIARSGVVLDARRGLFPWMALPVRLFVGGRLGDGQQAMPWIHIADQAAALGWLLENDSLHGAFNLVAPEITANAEFMRLLARQMHRPYWLPTPAFLLRLVLGEMSVLVTEGRPVLPKRLLESGFKFKYPAFDLALADLFRRSKE